MTVTDKNLLVLGLDIATTTGWAHGRVDAKAPKWGVIRFGGHNALPSEIFAAALTWANNFMRELKPDVLIVEALLPPTAMKNHTSTAVRDRLCGLNAIIIACAKLNNVGEITSASVQDIRAHFINERSLRRQSAKEQVMEKCKSLGWNVPNHNAADAVACWSYACAIIDPRLALRGSPLFSRIASVWP